MILASSKGKQHIYVDCHCGCDSGLRIRIEPFIHSDIYTALFRTPALIGILIN